MCSNASTRSQVIASSREEQICRMSWNVSDDPSQEAVCVCGFDVDCSSETISQNSSIGFPSEIYFKSVETNYAAA